MKQDELDLRQALDYIDPENSRTASGSASAWD